MLSRYDMDGGNGTERLLFVLLVGTDTKDNRQLWDSQCLSFARCAVQEWTVKRMADLIDGLSFSFIVLILLMLYDIRNELRLIRHKLKDGERE